MIKTFSSVDVFKKMIEQNAARLYQKNVNQLNVAERFDVLVNSIKESMFEDWKRCNQNIEGKKEIHYK